MYGLQFPRDSADLGTRKPGMVSTRSENRTGFYIWPMEASGVRPSELLWLPCLSMHQKLPHPPQNPGSMWQAAGWRFLCKARAHQSQV